MPFKDMLKQMYKDYFAITTGVLFCEVSFCLIFMPEVTFTVKELGNALLAGGLYSLPHLAFYSPRELNKKKWLTRMVLHFLLLEITVISSAHFLFHWLEGWDVAQHVVMVVMIFLVYLLVIFTGWRKDQYSAEKINQRLKEISAEETE